MVALGSQAMAVACFLSGDRQLSGPGIQPHAEGSTHDSHYQAAPPGALNGTPKPQTAAEARFLAIGDGTALEMNQPN